ncbi:MAG: hypothetical protein MUF48_18265, partial [Pirellulaceae bacterium]|nr:hypothetical protein [Pirellulaceae bacterium]
MTGHTVLRVVVIGCMVWTRTILAQLGTGTEEPNIEMASGWWPDIENTWVPIGWKDHPLRFNVLYNGTLI